MDDSDRDLLCMDWQFIIIFMLTVYMLGHLGGCCAVKRLLAPQQKDFKIEMTGCFCRVHTRAQSPLLVRSAYVLTDCLW